MKYYVELPQYVVRLSIFRSMFGVCIGYEHELVWGNCPNVSKYVNMVELLVDGG